MARRQGRIEGPKGRRQQREEGHKDHERSGKGGGTPVLLNADIDQETPSP